MNVREREAVQILAALSEWERTGALDPERAAALRGSLTVIPFDWRRLAKYSILVSLCCLIAAVSAALSDAYLRRVFEFLFNAPHWAKCVLLAMLAALIYAVGIRLRRRNPKLVFSSEAILFLGVLATAAAVFQFGAATLSQSEHFSLLILLACLIYGVLGVVFGSNLIWLFALLSFGSWLGAETGYVSGWGAYFLGMNYPARFSVFGLFLTIAAAFLKTKPLFVPFDVVTRTMGLLYLFVSLWILSIFGNVGDEDAWARATHLQLLPWCGLFALVALGAIGHGLRNDDPLSRGFGLTFLFINLYTRFFEYFWDSMSKAIFFAVLAFSFWILGRKAEDVWNLGRTEEARRPCPTDAPNL